MRRARAWPALNRHLRALGGLQVHWRWMDKAKAHAGHLMCHRPLAPVALHGLEGFQETIKAGIAAKSRQDVIKA